MITLAVTEPLRAEHRELVPHIDELAHTATWVSTAPAPVVREKLALHGLHAIVSLHFAKEEEIYLPILDRTLTPRDAQLLFDRMETASLQHGQTSR